MRARDDELRECELSQRGKRDLRLPQAALGHQRPRALLERGREGEEASTPSRPLRKVAQERLRLAWAVAPELDRAGREGVGSRIPLGDARRRRLDRGQRAELGEARGGEEADDPAVGVAAEMVATLQQRREPAGVGLEVDALGRRAAREAGPVEDDEVEPLPELALAAPRRRAVRDGAVDEHETGHRSIVQSRRFSSIVGRFPSQTAAMLASKMGRSRPRRSAWPARAPS